MMKSLSIGIVAAAAISVGIVFLGTTKQPEEEIQHQLIQSSSESIDLRVVEAEADVVQAVFQLKNVSNRRLVLHVTRKSCGCMEVDCPVSIDPQACAQLTVRIDPKKKPGFIHGVTGVSVDDPPTEFLQCVVNLDAIPAIAIVPNLISFQLADAAQELSHELMVTVRNAPQQRKPNVSFAVPGIRGTFGEPKLMGSQNARLTRTQFPLTISVDNSNNSFNADAQSVQGVVDFDGHCSEFSVQVNKLHHPCLIGPTVVRLSRSELQQQSIKLWCRNKTPFRILNSDSRMQGLELRTPSQTESHVQELCVRITEEGSQSSVSESSELQLRTTLPNMPPYRLRVQIDP